MPKQNLSKNILYDDKDVKIRDNMITIKCYYFPTGQSKRVSYSEIKNVQLKPLLCPGRLWGMDAGQMGCWFPGDKDRFSRTKYVQIDTGSSISPCFTSEKIQLAFEILSRALIDYKKGNKQTNELKVVEGSKVQQTSQQLKFE